MALNTSNFRFFNYLMGFFAIRFYDNLFPGGTMVLGTHEAITGFFKTKFVKNGPVYTKSNVFHFKY